MSLINYKSLIRSLLTQAAPVWEYAGKAEFQVFRNRVLITKLPRVSPFKILHKQTFMEVIKSYASRLARELYLGLLRIHKQDNYIPSTTNTKDSWGSVLLGRRSVLS